MEIIIKTSLTDKIKSNLRFSAFKFFLFVANKINCIINCRSNRIVNEFAASFCSKAIAPMVARFDPLDYEDRGYISFDAYCFDIIYNGHLNDQYDDDIVDDYDF